MKHLLSVFKVLIIITLSVILLINILFLGMKIIFKQDLPKIFGFSQAIVISGSMQPLISKGDMVIFYENNNYEVGNVIIFKREGTFITHRIVEINGNEYITKGDANNANDNEPISLSQIQGKMVGIIPGFSRITTFFKEPVGLFLMATAGLLIISISQLIRFFKDEGEK